MIKRQITYMIGLRPKGSTTYTPVNDRDIERETDAYANFFATRERAELICNKLKEAEPHLQFEIFEFRQVGYTVSCGGGGVD